MINFLADSLVLLAPHSYQSAEALPGCFPVLDFDRRSELGIKSKLKSPSPKTPRLSELLNGDADQGSEQDKVDLLAVTYSLIQQFADLYKSEECFIEMFEPFVEILPELKISKYSDALQVSVLVLQLRELRCPSAD